MNAISERKVKPAKHDDRTESGKDQNSERLAELIRLISDGKSLLLFNTSFLGGGDNSEILRTQLKLTRKQYYSAMSCLINAGLVKRRKGRYLVTAFGNVIYDAQKLLGDALKNYWKLKAIDSLGGATGDADMPKEESSKIIDLMIGNQQIKEILLSNKF